jgi:hypothetical protein
MLDYSAKTSYPYFVHVFDSTYRLDFVADNELDARIQLIQECASQWPSQDWLEFLHDYTEIRLRALQR